jgi:hypothetical protein
MPRGMSCRVGYHAARDVVPRWMSCGTAVASGEIERVRNVDLSSFNPDAFGELVCASWDAVFPERVLFECGATARTRMSQRPRRTPHGVVVASAARRSPAGRPLMLSSGQ